MSEPPCVGKTDIAAMQVRKFMHHVGFPRLQSFPLYKLTRAICNVAPVFYYSHPIFVCRAFARSRSRYNVKSVVYCFRVLHCSEHEILTARYVYWVLSIRTLYICMLTTVCLCNGFCEIARLLRKWMERYFPLSISCWSVCVIMGILSNRYVVYININTSTV